MSAYAGLRVKQVAYIHRYTDSYITPSQFGFIWATGAQDCRTAIALTALQAQEYQQECYIVSLDIRVVEWHRTKKGALCALFDASTVLPIRNEKCSDMMSDNIEKRSDICNKCSDINWKVSMAFCLLGEPGGMPPRKIFKYYLCEIEFGSNFD